VYSDQPNWWCNDSGNGKNGGGSGGGGVIIPTISTFPTTSSNGIGFAMILIEVVVVMAYHIHSHHDCRLHRHFYYSDCSDYFN